MLIRAVCPKIVKTAWKGFRRNYSVRALAIPSRSEEGGISRSTVPDGPFEALDADSSRVAGFMKVMQFHPQFMIEA